MRFLEIPDKTDEIDISVIGYLQAVMCSPNDVERQASYTEYLRCQALLAELKSRAANELITIATALRLVASPKSNDIESALKSAAHAGGIAGQILLFILDEAKLSSSKATLTAAFELVYSKLRDRRSRSHLNEVWNQYAPVSHLWAAQQLLSKSEAPDEAGDFPCSLGQVPLYLAVAEALRQEGEVFRPAHSATFLLDAKKVWKTSPSLNLPRISLQLAST
jgi:hypothetical protein